MLDRYFSLKGKVAMVTGASRGLGKAMALGMAEAGADVILVSRNEVLMNETALQINELGRKALVTTADIMDPQEIKDVVNKGIEHFGSIDILINNAGISGTIKLFSQYTDSEYAEIVNTNMLGTVNSTRHVAEHMIKNGGGKIINIASVLGTIGTYYSCIYSMTKAAIIQMTKNLALEWARYHININTIAPGAFDTDMIKSQLALPNAKEALLKNIPLRRFGIPDDIVGLAILLASPAAAYITGALFPIDGGFAISKM